MEPLDIPTSAEEAARPRAPLAPDRVPQLLRRLRSGLETLLNRGGIDARASRQGEVQYKVGACRACREAKTKCSGEHPCKRCTSTNQTCEYLQHARRGRKREPTPNAVLIVSLLRDAEAVYTAVTGEAVEEKPLDVLRGVKPSVVKTPFPAASSSRTPPKLEMTPAPTTSSSVSSGPADLIVNASSQDEEEDGTPEEDLALPLPAEAESSSSGLRGLIANPLAILAHVASGPKKRLETSEHESGTGAAFIPALYDVVSTADSFFSTGLYEIRLDVADELDVVNLGLMTDQQLHIVVDFYFNHLYSTTFHLNPVIHTPALLRNTSPFLTTVLAYIVAGFIPTLSHLVPALHQHTLFLSTRIFSLGFKSLEIVQAYGLLAEWAPAANNHGSDRTWSWIGMAQRIISELRMDKETNSITTLRYGSATELPPNALELFPADRRKSVTLLNMTEISAAVASGRFEAISGLSFFGGFRVEPGKFALGDINFTALAALHRIYAKSLMLAAGLREEMSPSSESPEIRVSFNASWEQEIAAWKKQWTRPSAQTQIIALHTQTILLSISLQFPGPVLPTLERCRQTALKTVKVVREKPDYSLIYGPSALVIAMAYAATLLLRMESLKPTAGVGMEYQTLRPLCAATAAALEAMAARRATVRTSASLHAVRLRKLLDEFDSLASASTSLPQPSISAPLDPNLNIDDSSLLAILKPFDNNLFGTPPDAGSVVDPTLSWLDATSAIDASAFPSTSGNETGTTTDATEWPAAWWSMSELGGGVQL
ncbi:hypothetical protein JCM8547_000669 [Rhodosporidiobolus lusitaniae]